MVMGVLMAKVSQVGVIGAGAMGSGIAQVGAQAGYRVILFDVSSAQLEKAKGSISKSLAKLAEKGKLKETAAAVAASIEGTTHFEALKACDFVVEAASENRNIKFKIFQDLDKLVRPGVVLATNTSSISITEIARQTTRPDWVTGMHFMNPVPIMTLVEGIRGLQTGDEAFQITREVAEAMGKVFIEAKDGPGFAVNRILMPLINEAFFALQEGLASAKDIDQAMKLGCNFPMGPLELADFVGIDICFSVCEVLYRDLGNPKYSPAPLMRKYCEAGWYGKKTGRGVYVY